VTEISKDLLERWTSQEEGQFFERKSAYERHDGRQRRHAQEVAKDVSETLVAMANADGGELVVGIEDDGQVTGVPYGERTIRLLERADRDRVLPPTGARATRMESGGMILLRFEISPSPATHQLTDGRYLLRVRDSNQPFPADQIAALKASKTQGLWERGYAPGASVDDLDLDLIAEICERTELGVDGSPSDVLLSYRLADQRNGHLVPNYAGLLLFGKEPSRWHARCGVDFRRYKGTEARVGRDLNLVGREIIEAPLAILIERTYEAVRPHIRERHVLHDLFFHERFEYPTFAWQEALVNAVAHRDYSIQGTQTELLMWDDRLEVHSPGLPPQPVTLEALRARSGLHVSRNPLIVRVLTALGYMREIGEGIPRMFEEMEREGLYPPELDTLENVVFRVTLRNAPVYDEVTLAWLKQFDDADLTGDQKRLLAYAHTHGGTFTSRGYQRLVGRDIYGASRDIKDLICKGIVRQQKPRGRIYELAPSKEPAIPPEFEAVKTLLAQQGFVTNSDIRQVFRVGRHRATALARLWVEHGLLRLHGAGRGARYLPGPVFGRGNAGASNDEPSL